MQTFPLWCHGRGYGFTDGLENFEHTRGALHLGIGVQAGAWVNGQAGQSVRQHLGLKLEQGMVARGIKGIAGGDLLPLRALAG